MSTAVWRLVGAPRAVQRAVGARAREGRRAALVGLPQQRGERLGGRRRRRSAHHAHLVTALRCRASAVTRHPPPPTPANKTLSLSIANNVFHFIKKKKSCEIHEHINGTNTDSKVQEGNTEPIEDWAE